MALVLKIKVLYILKSFAMAAKWGK